MHKVFIYLGASLVILGGCSRHSAGPSAAVQGSSPEPVERTAPTQPQGAIQPASPYDQPVPYAQTPTNQSAPVSAEPVAPALQPAPNPAPSYGELVVPAGTPLRVRLDESLGTKYDPAGTRFYATLADPIVEDGRTLLPTGTRFAGLLTESKPSGRLKGRAVLAIRLEGLDWRGRMYPIQTFNFTIASRGRKRHDFRWIGGGGGFGAIVGAFAGGGGGALIGAGAGAAAGTAGALVSHRKQVHLGAETAVTFRLRAPVRIG